MYEYLHDYYMEAEPLSYEERASIVWGFFDKHPVLKSSDVYRWLWEGEFGPGQDAPRLNLDRLTDDLRRARTARAFDRQTVWEPLGLGMKLIKVNIAPYSDAGLPLNTLIHLAKRTSDIRPDSLRFKKDWSFVKTQIVPGLSINMESLTDFENSIAFHMTPEVSYSGAFIEEYGLGYRIVPRSMFFQNFPEFNPGGFWDLLDQEAENS